jgi:hypothetical protein
MWPFGVALRAIGKAVKAASPWLSQNVVCFRSDSTYKRQDEN